MAINDAPVLPERPRHAFGISLVDPVPIPQKETWRLVPRKRFDDLRPRPICSRVRGDIEVENAPSIVDEETEEDEEDLVAHGWHDEEVSRDDHSDVPRGCGLRA